MDMLRSCMVSYAELGVQRGHRHKIRWFLCKPGAKAFPAWNAIVSPVWEPQPYEWTKGPGVEEDPVGWSPNHIPCPPGQEFHGEAEWYASGIPEDVWANPGPHEHPVCPGYLKRFRVEAKGSLKFRKPGPAIQGSGQFRFEFL